MAMRFMDDGMQYGDELDGVFPDRAAQFMEGSGLYGDNGVEGLFPDRSARFVDDPVGSPLGGLSSAELAQPMGGTAPYGGETNSVFFDRTAQPMGGGRKATAWPFVWKHGDGSGGAQVFLPAILLGLVGSLICGFPGFALLTNFSVDVWLEGSQIGRLATWILLVTTIVAAAAPVIAAAHVIAAVSVEYARDSQGRMWVVERSRGAVAREPGTLVSVASAVGTSLTSSGLLASFVRSDDANEALRNAEAGRLFEQALANGDPSRFAQRIDSVQSYATGPFVVRVSCMVEPFGGGQLKRRRFFVSRSCNGLDELMCELDSLVKE